MTTDKKKTDDVEADWVSFGVYTLYSLIAVIIIGLIGGNFIFLTHYDNLDLIFPTNCSDYFNKANMIRGGGFKCKPNTDYGINLKNLGYGDLSGFPYNLKTNNEIGITFQGWKNWFATTIANVYIDERNLLKNFYSNKAFTSMHGGILMLLGVLVFILGSGLIPLFSFVSTVFRGLTNKYMGLPWSILGLFIGYSTLMMGLIPVLHSFKFVYNSLITPLLLDSQMFMYIMQCSSGFLSMLFGLFVVISGLQTLDSTTSIVMLVTYIILLAKYLFMG